MTLLDVIFIVFGCIAIGSSLLMIFTLDVFRAAFLLLICLVSLAAIYVLMAANYLAVIQLLIYAGGVVVLLAFGIMLTNRSNTGSFKTSNHLIIPGLIVGIALPILFYRLFKGLNYVDTGNIPADQVSFMGKVFITDYLIAFELIAFLLLVVLVGAALYSKKSSET